MLLPVCLAIGYSLAFWDTPFFPDICSDPAMADKIKFPTIVRVSPSYQKTGGAFLELFQKYKWKNAFMVTALGICDMGATGIYEKFLSNNISVSEWIRTAVLASQLTDADIVQYLSRARDRARIIILCHDLTVRRRIMYAAQDLGMTGPDYVFLYYWLLPGGDTLQPWADTDPPQRHEAWYALKQLTIANMDQSYQQQLIQRYRNASLLPPWNFTPAQSQIVTSPYNAYVEDAAYAYLLCVARAVAAGRDHTSGRVLFNMSLRLQFHGVTGRVVIDDNGDRDPEYWVWSYGPGQTQFQPYAEIKVIGNDKKEVDVIGTPSWRTHDNKPPPDTPACGFTGSLCPPDTTLRDAVVSVVCSLVACGVIFAVIFLYYRKRRQAEEEVRRMVWKLDASELIPLKHGINASLSAINIASSRISVFSTEGDGPKQLYTRVATCRGRKVAVRRLGPLTAPLTHDDLLRLKELKMMSHDNINTFVGAIIQADLVCVVETYCQKGSLQDIIQDDNLKLDLVFKVSLLNDLVNGMLFIHKSLFECHGNLTSGNCLVDSRWGLKISFAQTMFRDKTLELSDALPTEYEVYWRQLWTAPELLRHETNKPTREADVYSFGIILQEVMYRNLPFFNEMDPKDVVKRVAAKDGHPFRPTCKSSELDNRDGGAAKGDAAADMKSNMSLQDGLLQLMKSCWAEMPNKRPTFPEIRTRLKEINAGRRTNIMDNMLHMLEMYANNLEDIVKQRTADLMDEKKKTEILLYQMLPKSVADKLKVGLTVGAEIFDNVTIYFSDIVGFTNLSSMSTPVQIVELLNDLYSSFDDVISRHDVYKVETIGDAYMVVSGLPQRNGDRHVQEICNMALDLRASSATFTVRHRPDYRLQIRIGLHTGPCAAGVVGLKMPRYCLFGDTVNMASRMESTGEALKIHLSETTQTILNEFPQYVTVFRGETFVKGKGDLKTYWLDGMTT